MFIKLRRATSQRTTCTVFCELLYLQVSCDASHHEQVDSVERLRSVERDDAHLSVRLERHVLSSLRRHFLQQTAHSSDQQEVRSTESSDLR